MSNDLYYFSIDKPSVAEFKDRGSKFLAYTFPLKSIDDVKKFLQQLKKEHPKANHHCFAYRIGLDGNIFRISDDGEPSGTAGKPILGVIDSKQLTNVLIIVIRYFGGTLLGVPGLINAYKTAAILALQVVPIVQNAIEIQYQVQYDYTMANEVMQLIKQHNCIIHKQETQLFNNIEIGVPKTRLEEVVSKFKALHTVSFKKI